MNRKQTKINKEMEDSRIQRIKKLNQKAYTFPKG